MNCDRSAESFLAGLGLDVDDLMGDKKNSWCYSPLFFTCSEACLPGRSLFELPHRATDNQQFQGEIPAAVVHGVFTRRLAPVFNVRMNP